MHEQRPSLKLIEIPMYIGAILYILIGIVVLAIGGAMFASGEDRELIIFVVAMMSFSAVLCFALGGFMIFATNQLKRRKKWAWITAIVFGAMFTPSAFVFLGIPILIGCFNTDVNNWFNPPAQQQASNHPDYSAEPNQAYETKDPYQPPRY